MRHQGSPGGSEGPSPAKTAGFRSESRRCALFLGAAAVLALAGCDDRVLDTGFGYRYFSGEAAPESPRDSPVRRMSGADPSYPSLYSVPDRPPPPPGPAERKAQMDRLAADREAARAAEDALKVAAPPPLEPPNPPTAGR